MMPRCVLVWRRIVEVCGILKRGLVNISTQKGVSDRNLAKLCIDRSFDYILRLLGMCVIILGTWIVHCVQVSVRFESICHRIEDSFSLGARLDLGEVLHYFTFI